MAIKRKSDYASTYKIHGLVGQKMGKLRWATADLLPAEKLQPSNYPKIEEKFMQIYINKNGQQIGPFAENVVLDMLGKGQLSPNDSAIRQGGQEWIPLSAMFPNRFQQPIPVLLTPQLPTLLATYTNKPRMKKRIVGGIYVASVVLLFFGLIVGAVMALLGADSEMSSLLVVGAVIAIFAYLQFLIVHLICMFYILFKTWDSIQDGISTSTGKAIGFLFIPIFSVYWIFKAWGGFPTEYNDFIERHQLKVPLLNSSVYTLVAVFALLSGLLVLPVIAVPFIFMAVISQTCDAVNRLNQGLNNKQAGNNLLVEIEKEALLSPIMRVGVFGLAGISALTLIALIGFGWWNLNPKPSADELPDTVGSFSKTQNLMGKGSFLGLRKQFGALYEPADKKKAIVYDIRDVLNDYEKKVYSYAGDRKGDVTDLSGNKVGEFSISNGNLSIFNGRKKIDIWDLNRRTPTYILPSEMTKEGKITSLSETEMLDFARSLPIHSQLRFSEATPTKPTG